MAELTLFSTRILRALPLIAAVGLGSLAAQAPDNREPQRPRFRGGTSQILVDVQVLDRDGTPVGGLKREDFEILEDGVAQTIEGFEQTDWTSYVVARTEGERPLDRASDSQTPRRFVFILNRRAADFVDLVRARRALERFVVEAMADGDEATVIDIGTSVNTVQERSTAKEVTIAAIRDLPRMPVQRLFRGDRLSYIALKETADDLAALPGRKIVVLFSMDLALRSDAGDEVPFLNDAVDSFNQSNVSVYSINLVPASSATSGFDGGLATLALETNGHYYRNQTTYRSALAEIGRENEQYYLLTYRAPKDTPDGLFHEITVRLREPSQDYEVIARKGYLARIDEPTEDDSGPDGADASRPAVADDDGSRGSTGATPPLPMAVEISTYLLPGERHTLVPFAISLPAELIDSTSASERHLTVELLNQGVVLSSWRQAVSAERFFMRNSVELEPGTYTLRLVVADPDQSAPVYEGDTLFDVIPMNADAIERLRLTSLVPLLSPGPVELLDDVAEGLSPVLAVPRGDNASLYFRILAPVRLADSEVRVGYRIERLLNGASTLVSEDVPGPIRVSDSPKGTPVALALPFADLGTGLYRVRVDVRHGSGGATSGEIELRVP